MKKVTILDWSVQKSESEGGGQCLTIFFLRTILSFSVCYEGQEECNVYYVLMYFFYIYLCFNVYLSAILLFLIVYLHVHCQIYTCGLHFTYIFYFYKNL